jgi:hypothetical protein
MSQPPESFAHDVTLLGFTIAGWDDRTAGIVGNGAEFVGSHEEVVAFLRGWMLHQEVAPREISRRVISLASRQTVIPPGMTAQITSRPQSASFRGDRIAIPEAIADRFVIHDVLVGNRSQFLQAGDVDGAMFAARIDKLPTFEFDGPHRVLLTSAGLANLGAELSMDECLTAMDITMYVSLKRDAPATSFAALIFGVCPQVTSTHSRMISAHARSAAIDIAGRALLAALREVADPGDLAGILGEEAEHDREAHWRQLTSSSPEPEVE